jgi:ribosome-binding protein aMBF1 (putative translation factor)
MRPSSAPPSRDGGAVPHARCASPPGDNRGMAQGKRIADIPDSVHETIRGMGAAAKAARTRAGEGQSAAAARLGVHVQTIARIESGEPGVAVGHVLGLLAQYGVGVTLQQPGAGSAP